MTEETELCGWQPKGKAEDVPRPRKTYELKAIAKWMTEITGIKYLIKCSNCTIFFNFFFF